MDLWTIPECANIRVFVNTCVCYRAKGIVQMGLSGEPPDGEVILDYPGGPNVMTALSCHPCRREAEGPGEEM